MACFTGWYIETIYCVTLCGHWNQEIADTYHNKSMNCFSKRLVVKNLNLPLCSSNDAPAVTNSSSESDIYLVIGQEGYMKGQKLKGATYFVFVIGDKSDATLGWRDTMCLYDWCIQESTLTGLLPQRAVNWGICDILGIISTDSISSPNGVGACLAATASVWGLTTAGTNLTTIPDFLSPWLR